MAYKVDSGKCVNCGACGYAGCDDYARALCNGAKTNLCIPGGDKVSAAVSAVLGTVLYIIALRKIIGKEESKK